MWVRLSEPDRPRLRGGSLKRCRAALGQDGSETFPPWQVAARLKSACLWLQNKEKSRQVCRYAGPSFVLHVERG